MVNIEFGSWGSNHWREAHLTAFFFDEQFRYPSNKFDKYFEYFHYSNEFNIAIMNYFIKIISVSLWCSYISFLPVVPPLLKSKKYTLGDVQYSYLECNYSKFEYHKNVKFVQYNWNWIIERIRNVFYNFKSKSTVKYFFQ